MPAHRRWTALPSLRYLNREPSQHLGRRRFASCKVSIGMKEIPYNCGLLQSEASLNALEAEFYSLGRLPGDTPIRVSAFNDAERRRDLDTEVFGKELPAEIKVGSRRPEELVAQHLGRKTGTNELNVSDHKYTICQH